MQHEASQKFFTAQAKTSVSVWCHEHTEIITTKFSLLWWC